MKEGGVVSSLFVLVHVCRHISFSEELPKYKTKGLKVSAN